MKAKTTLGLIKLWRRHAEIHQNPIDSTDCERIKRWLKFRESRMRNLKSRILSSKVPSDSDRGGIPIKPNQSTTFAQLSQNSS